MKYLVVLLTLFTAVLTEDLTCKAKFLDSYVMRGGYYGSIVNGSESAKGFYSVIGRNARAVIYIADNPTGSMDVRNFTFLIYDGVTGEILSSGWTWNLCENGTLYSTGMINGKLVPCTMSKCAPVGPASELTSKLNTLYPIAGIPSAPGAAAICQGAVDIENTAVILNIVWRPVEIDYPLYFTTLSSTYTMETKVESMRKLTDHDAKDFENVCKKIESRKPREYFDLFDKISGALYSMF